MSGPSLASLIRAVRRWLTDPSTWALAAVVAVAGIARYHVMTGPAGRLEADEAVTGIMAQHILRGETYAFFAGQTYMGALEQYLQALVLAATPDTPTTLRMVQVVLSMAVCALVGVAGWRMSGSRAMGIAAAALFAVGPFFNWDKGIRSHGAYVTGQLLLVVCLLLVIHLSRDPRHPRRAAFAVGLTGGLILWESASALMAVLPVIWWGVGLARGRWMRLVPPAVLGAVVGAAPFIVHRAVHGLLVRSGTGQPPPTSIAERAELLLTPIMGMYLGVRQIGGGYPISQFAPPAVVTMLAFAALGAAVWARRRGIANLIRLRGSEATAIDAVVVSLAYFIVPYCLTDYTWFAHEPRYLFSLYPFTALAVMYGVWRLPRRVAAVVAAGLVAATFALSMRTLDIVNGAGGAGGAAFGSRVFTEETQGFVDALRRVGVTGVRTDYWLAYPIEFEAEGGLAVAPYTDTRFPDAEARIAASTRVAYVLMDGPDVARYAAAIAKAGSRAKKIQVGHWVGFYDLTPPRTPAELGLP